MAWYFRCGNCNLNYPDGDSYTRCLKCSTPTARMQSYILSDILSETEIQRLRFEHYLETETPAMREQRKIRGQQKQVDDARRLSEFPQVIEGGGFQPWERKRIAELEAQLGQPPTRSQTK